jgi:hypothetical protein
MAGHSFKESWNWGFIPLGTYALTKVMNRLASDNSIQAMIF